MKIREVAKPGNIFVLTESGYDFCSDSSVREEREVGKPIIGFETSVPITWVNEGWVKEVKMNDKE